MKYSIPLIASISLIFIGHSTFSQPSIAHKKYALLIGDNTRNDTDPEAFKKAINLNRR